MSQLLPILNDYFTPSSLSSILQQLFLLSSQIANDFLVSVKNTAIQKRISTDSLAIHTRGHTLCLLSVTLECVLPRKLPPVAPQYHSLSLTEGITSVVFPLSPASSAFPSWLVVPSTCKPAATLTITYHVFKINTYTSVLTPHPTLQTLFSVSTQNYLKKLSIQAVSYLSFLLNSLSVLNHTSRIDPVKVTMACKLLKPMGNLRSSF